MTPKIEQNLNFEVEVKKSVKKIPLRWIQKLIIYVIVFLNLKCFKFKKIKENIFHLESHQNV